tara:strand:+ start:680 stop:1639 length:960 start_codon:yes stop_codon:yes gene_type:complete
MAFKLKGMTFGKGTGYKSPQMMKKEAAMKMAKKSAMKKTPPSEGEMRMAMRKTVKELTPKSRATNRKPQSQMTDAELAEAKGIKNPQSVKPTPPRRRYGDTPNKMAKKSAMKKKDDLPKTRTTTRRLTPKEAMAYSAISSGLIPGTKNIGRGKPLSKYKTVDGKKVKIYDSADIKKNPGESDKDYRDRVHKSNQKEFRKTFVKSYKKVKENEQSPKTMKKGSAMDMKKGSAMKKKQKTRTFKNPFTGATRTTTKGPGGKTVEVRDKEGNLQKKKIKQGGMKVKGKLKKGGMKEMRQDVIGRTTRKPGKKKKEITFRKEK